MSRISFAQTAAGRRFGAAVVALSVVVCGGTGRVLLSADAQPQSIKDVEAAFVYQFTRYVEWPAESFDRAGNDFAITVVGDRDLSKALTALVSNKGFDGRKYRVQYVDEVAAAPFAHIVFVGGVGDPSVALSSGLDFEGHALTVSDHETFTRAGGIMRLYEDQNRVRIEVNIDAARRSELKISSKLLDLARIVRDESD